MLTYFDLNESTYKNKTTKDTNYQFHKDIDILLLQEIKIHNEPLNT